MGNMCSSRQIEGQALNGQLVPEIEQARNFAKDIRNHRQKLQQVWEYLKDFKAQLQESDNKNDSVILLEMEDKSKQIGQLIDLIEFPPNKKKINYKPSLIEQQKNVSVSEQHVKDFENKYNDLKKQWRKYLVENDNSATLLDELTQMFQRINSESGNYENFMVEVKAFVEDLIKLLFEVLEEQEVKKDYEDKQESLQKHKEIILQYQKEYQALAERVQKALECIRELQRLFNECAKDREKLSCEELESINDQAHQFLEFNRTLGSDIMNLQKSLNERREKLFDLNLKENIGLRRLQFDTLYNLAVDIEDSVNVMMRAIEMQLISSIDDTTNQIFTPLKQEVEQINQTLRQKINILIKLSGELGLLEELVDSVDKQDELKVEKIQVLIPYIRKLSKLGVSIKEFKKDLEQLQHDIEMKKLVMGDTNIDQKVDAHSQLSLQHRESLNNLKGEIQTMLGLFTDLYEYASDDEEQQNIQSIKAQVENLKLTIDQVEKQCTKTSKEIEDFINELQELQDENGDFSGLFEKISEIEKQVNQDDKVVEDLTEKIQKKAQRFNEFDLKSKYMKRYKQLEEGKVFRNKVKNRSNKMVRKTNEKADLNLSEEDTQKLNELRTKALDYKNEYDMLSQNQDDLLKFLEEELGNQIPEDPLSISITDQIILLKEMKQLKLKIQENNDKLQKLRENLMVMQDDVTAISDIQLDLNDCDQNMYEDYTPTSNDQMDSLMSDFLKNGSKKLQIQITRLAPGQYQFGSKKILTKIVNGKLMVRVGGGVMSVDEFIATYAEKELQKQIEKEYEDLNSVQSFSAAGLAMQKKRTMAAAARKQANSHKNSSNLIIEGNFGTPNGTPQRRKIQ